MNEFLIGLFILGRKIAFGFRLQLITSGAFSAVFPDDTGRPELTIAAGVGAGHTILQALQAVADFQFTAFNRGFPIGMKTTVHGEEALTGFWINEGKAAVV
jgi:hypothetical protein